MNNNFEPTYPDVLRLIVTTVGKKLFTFEETDPKIIHKIYEQDDQYLCGKCLYQFHLFTEQADRILNLEHFPVFYGPDGKVSFLVEALSATMYLSIILEDNGPGFKPEQKEFMDKYKADLINWIFIFGFHQLGANKIETIIANFPEQCILSPEIEQQEPVYVRHNE